MQLHRVAQFVFGSFATYVVVSACAGRILSSSTEGSHDRADSDPTRILDAIANPVGQARAGTPPVVATEKCDVPVNLGGGGSWYFAEHSFPGKTIDELTLVAVRFHYRTGSSDAGDTLIGPPGYADQITSGVFVKDGAVTVSCGSQTPPGAFVESVVFVLPASPQ